MTEQEKQIEMEIVLAELYMRENSHFITPKRVAEHLTAKGYRKESEVVAGVLGKIREEIRLALDSNYKARQEHIDKYFKGALYIYDNFISLVDGKIQALRGINDFIDEIEKKHKGAE